MTTIPARDPRATPEQEAARLAAIRDGTDWRSDAERVRHTSGAMGWRRGMEIYADDDASLSLMSIWRRNSKEDQEDLGVPADGYFTAYGYWFPA